MIGVNFINEFHSWFFISFRDKQIIFTMLFRKLRIKLSSFWTIIVLFSLFIAFSQAQFELNTLQMSSPAQSFTVAYNKTLSTGTLNFAYFIQSATVSQPQFRLKHSEPDTSIQSTQFTIKLILEGVPSMAVGDILKVKILISSYSSAIFKLGIISTTPGTQVATALPVAYDAAASIKQLEAKVFILNIPMLYIQSMNSTHLKILPTKTPTVVTEISFSIIIITRDFLSYNVGLFIDQLQITNLGWIIVFNNDSFFDPSDQTMLVGISKYQGSMTPVIDNQDEIDYNFTYPLVQDQRTVYVFYSIYSGAPTVLDATIFIFSQIFAGCPDGGFLTYTDLYYDSPLNCQSCHITCETCTSTNYSLTFTDENSCLTCGAYKYLEKTVDTSKSGQCKCYPGLTVDPLTQQCSPCSTDCLGFDVSFMRSSTDSDFLLTFSSIVDLTIPMQSNLKISVNANSSPVSFTVQQIKTNFYKVKVDSKALEPCSTTCSVTFSFQKPWKIIKKGKNEALSQNSTSVQISNYYTVGDKIPEQLNQAFTVSSMLVGATASGGLSSLLKMLFELEQMIQFHKYLNLELPLVFKEFIESLSMFKFLDITTVFPFDIDQTLRNLSTSQFDTKGPIKSIYYEYGSNFYKNIIPCLVSFGIVLLINLILIILLRMIPCKFTWRFSQKLRLRALITYSDLVQSTVMPIVVFAHFQLFLVYFRLNIIWIYAMATALVFYILIHPFLMISHVYINKDNEEMRQIYDDLLHDCSINSKATYIYYITGFYRKVMFSISLLYFVPGKIQAYSVIAINSVYLALTFYIIIKRVYNSKIKMLTKTINILCIIGIEGIMIFYNNQIYGIQLMLDLGVACVYLAIIATVAGILEALIKFFEIIFLNVKETQNDKKVNSDEKSQHVIEKDVKLDKDFADPIYCNIGKDTGLIAMNSKDTIDTSVDPDSKRKDRKSLFARQKNKLNFISNLMKKGKNNQNDESKQEKKINVQEESFQKMIDRNELVSMDSFDDFEYNLVKKKKNQSQGIYNERYPSNLKKANTIGEQLVRGMNRKMTNLSNEPNSEQKLNKSPKQVDQEIKQVQDRLRQKLNLKRKFSQQNQNIKKRQFRTIEQDSNDSQQKKPPIKPKIQKRGSSTQRVKNQEKDDKLMENINQQKTARRKNKRTVDNLKVSQNKKKDDDDPDDIYYIK